MTFLKKPETKYTKSGRINIAYQVFGSGPLDLVYIPGWVSNIDWMWACPELVDFFTALGKMVRVILFDKRGTGLSDRVVELSTLEERMDDIRAVMDAVDSEKAILFGHSEGGSVSALFAATYPDRTIALITFGIFAKRRYAPEYPWAPTVEERQKVYDMIENSWGSGDMDLESLAPSKADDKIFMDWLANYFRSGASPSAAMVLTKMNTEVDIIDILGSIKVPTLILQRTRDVDVKIEEGRFIADHIENAQFIELEGSDHLFWVGDTDEILDHIRSFISKEKPVVKYEEKLFTIVAGRIHSENRLSQALYASIDSVVAQYRGRKLRYTGETFIAFFEGPSKAVHCSIEIAQLLQSKGIKVSIGIQIREGAVDQVQFISKDTEQFIEAILELARPHHILITQTVKNLLWGAGLNFLPFSKMYESRFDETISLYRVTDHLEDVSHELTSAILSGNESLLENVLQSIDAHLSDEDYTVEVLCRETGVSERQLQRKLKAITNKSPIQLITSVRLHRARELLLQRRLTVSEIAFQTGFTSPSYFSKRFRREFGHSPSELN